MKNLLLIQPFPLPFDTMELEQSRIRVVHGLVWVGFEVNLNLTHSGGVEEEKTYSILPTTIC